MKGFIKHSSGALIAIPTAEQQEIQSLRIIINAVIKALPEDILNKIDSEILEAIGNDGTNSRRKCINCHTDIEHTHGEP